MNTPPLFWLMDSVNGYLQFYATTQEVNNNNIEDTTNIFEDPQDPEKAPKISCFKYIGNVGLSNLGGGELSNGDDASFNNVEVSGNIILQGNNLMQSYTAEPWDVPQSAKYYIIAETQDSLANSLGYFSIQLGDPYRQVLSFYAGVLNNKEPFIKIISSTNEDFLTGFIDLKIIEDPSANIDKYYIVINFDSTQQGVAQAEYLKIFLINNNENSDISSNNIDWLLRNDDDDWTQNGPSPPDTKIPWYDLQTPLPPDAQPTLPASIIDISLGLIGGGPFGLSTQPEYFQNHIVMGPSGNIIANDGTGTIDICGNLYVDLDSTFNQSVYMKDTLDICGNLTVEDNVDICGNLEVLNKVIIGGNLTVDHIISNAPSSSIDTGLIIDANNLYYKVNNAHQGAGFVIDLDKSDDSRDFKILDNSLSTLPLFSVDGGGITKTQDIHPPFTRYI